MKTVYYENELEDEFSEAAIKPREIGDTYSYEGGFLRKIGRIFFYHILAKPLAWCFLKIKFGYKIANQEVLREIKHRGSGYFLYGNHTNAVADALIPTMLNFRGSVYVIVHPNNVSMPFLGRITPSLGALPLPDTKLAMKHFEQAIVKYAGAGNCITIYPEAHIWPYYTKIRPFTKASFGYPLKCAVPVYCFTNTYQKRRFRKTPRIVTYVDGPFVADEKLSVPMQKQQLRDRVYEAMVKRSAMNNVEMIRYEKKEVQG